MLGDIYEFFRGESPPLCGAKVANYDNEVDEIPAIGLLEIDHGFGMYGELPYKDSISAASQAQVVKDCKGKVLGVEPNPMYNEAGTVLSFKTDTLMQTRCLIGKLLKTT